MTELKYGGGDVKIMYGSQEIGGATKLEPGTILYISGQDVSKYNNELGAPLSTAEITFPSAGKHWEGLKKIRISYKTSYLYYEQVFDVNLIDKPTQDRKGDYTIRRERSLTDEADKLIVTTTADYYNTDLFVVAVE